MDYENNGDDQLMRRDSLEEALSSMIDSGSGGILSPAGGIIGGPAVGIGDAAPLIMPVLAMTQPGIRFTTASAVPTEFHQPEYVSMPPRRIDRSKRKVGRGLRVAHVFTPSSSTPHSGVQLRCMGDSAGAVLQGNVWTGCRLLGWRSVGGFFAVFTHDYAVVCASYAMVLCLVLVSGDRVSRAVGLRSAGGVRIRDDTFGVGGSVFSF